MPKPAVSVLQNEDEFLLVRRAQEDPAEFRTLYERYFRPIYVFIYHRVGDKSTAADLTSQVFLKALTAIKKFTFQGAPFSSWLYRIALNECNDFFRRSNRYRYVAIDHGTFEHLHDELTVNTGLADLQARLPSILAALSNEELYLLELRFFEQRPFREVAEILEITETYAKVRVYRLLEKMKKQFLAGRGPNTDEV